MRKIPKQLLLKLVISIIALISNLLEWTGLTPKQLADKDYLALPQALGATNRCCQCQGLNITFKKDDMYQYVYCRDCQLTMRHSETSIVLKHSLY